MKQRTTIIFGKQKGRLQNVLESFNPFFKNIARKIAGRGTRIASDVIDNTFDDFERTLREKGFIKR